MSLAESARAACGGGGGARTERGGHGRNGQVQPEQVRKQVAQQLNVEALRAGDAGEHSQAHAIAWSCVNSADAARAAELRP